MPVNPSAPKQEYNLRNFRILIAEDFEFMIALLSGMLREYGVGRVLVARDGNEARDLIRLMNSDPGSPDQIDLALIDWLMPNMNGTDLLRWIRGQQQDSIRFMPTMLISAYTSEEVVKAARDNGAHESLMKPISATMLAKRILHMIDYPRPFVKAPGFFGPDRRRQDKKWDGVEKRIKSEGEVKSHHERL